MENNAAFAFSRIPGLPSEPFAVSVSHGLTPSSPIPAAVSDRVKPRSNGGSNAG